MILLTVDATNNNRVPEVVIKYSAHSIGLEGTDSRGGQAQVQWREESSGQVEEETGGRHQLLGKEG